MDIAQSTHCTNPSRGPRATSPLHYLKEEYMDSKVRRYLNLRHGFIIMMYVGTYMINLPTVCNYVCMIELKGTWYFLQY